MFESGAANPRRIDQGKRQRRGCGAVRAALRRNPQRRPGADLRVDPRRLERSVTTGLLSAVRYLKDNRLLPHGFDKQTADPEIGVRGEAADDEDFGGGGDRVRYSAAVTDGDGPFEIEAELLYQPIGFRWASNLKRYSAPEPRRFNGYYDAMSDSGTAFLARATKSVR